MPRAPGAARRRARWSPLGHELEAGLRLDIAHGPARGLDLVAETVARLEILLVPSFDACASEILQLGWRLCHLGERLEPEDLEPAAQEVVVPPAVHHRQRLGSVEVVLERSRERSPVAAGRRLAPEDVAEALGLRRRLFEHLVRVVDRLAPVAA